MTIEFKYAGSVRVANVVENGETFFKCENVSINGGKPSRPFSTYSKDKMENLKILSADPLTK